MTPALFIFACHHASLVGAPLLLGARARGGAGTGSVVLWLVIAAVVIAAIIGGLFVAVKINHQNRFNSHSGLFKGLCRVHGLDRSSCRLLRQVVQCRGLTQPARVFVEPRLLDTSKLPAPLQPRAEELAALRAKLFNVPNEKDEEPASSKA